MNVDDIIDEIISDLASGLIDKDEDEIEAALDAYDLDPEDRAEVWEMIRDVRDADSLADDDAKRAQRMANEDNTDTEVIQKDTDDDGDVDSVTIKKTRPKTDDLDFDMSDAEGDKPHDKGLAGDTTIEEDLMLNPSMSPTEYSKRAAEKRGAKRGEPAPDFDNSTNAIANLLASRRW